MNLYTVKKEASDSTQLSALKSQLDSVRAELVAKQQEIDRLNRAEEEGDHRDLVKELNVTKSQVRDQVCMTGEIDGVSAETIVTGEKASVTSEIGMTGKKQR